MSTFVPLAKKELKIATEIESNHDDDKKKRNQKIHLESSRAYFSLFLFICDNSDDNGKSFLKILSIFLHDEGEILTRIKLKEEKI